MAAQRLILASLVLFVWVSATEGLTLQVEPQSEECVYEDVAAGKSFELNFEVIRGGLLDIQLKVYNPKGRVILEKMAYFSRKTDDENDAEGKVQFTASFTGKHKICFDNQMSRWTAKVVTFKIPDGQSKKDEIARLEHLGPVVDSVIKISDDLDTIERLQHHMRVREQVHRDGVDSTNSKVQWLSILESALMVTAGFLQMRYIRNWFSDKDHSRPRV